MYRNGEIRSFKASSKHLLTVMLVVLVFSFESVAQPSVDEVLDEAEAAFAKRNLLIQLNRAISLYESLSSQLDLLPDVQRAHVLNRLSQLYYELGVFKGDEDEKNREFFEKGKHYGLQSLSLNAQFQALQNRDFQAAIRAVSDPAPLLWTANNWGVLLGFDSLGGLPQLPQVRVLYERCLEVDATYWGGSCHNALGAMLASLPSFLGGDFERAKTHLNRAVQLAPDYLTNRVALAEFVGFSHDVLGNINGVHDRALIKRELNFVLEAPVGDWPFWNNQAKTDAQALLKILNRF